MANIFARMLGSEKFIDKGMSTIDKAFYTKQEKAEDHIKVIGMKVRLLKAFEAFKITQRFLSLIFCMPYALGWTATFAASFWVDVSFQLELLSGDINKIVWTIVGFYFLGGVAESIGRSKK